MERSSGPGPFGSEAGGDVGRVSPRSVPSLQLAVGLGDPERERDLLPALVEAGDLVVTERCLSGDQLLECVRRERIDVVLAAEGLHRLTLDGLADLGRARIPLVVLTSEPGNSRWRSVPGLILPLDADPTKVRQALLAAVRGDQSVPRQSITDSSVEVPPTLESTDSTVSLSVMAVASGPGSPGRTTVALNLAAALGTVAPTILVDADLSGPSVAAHVDADPTRNLYMLAHAEPETPADWSHAIEQEIQPLGGRSVHGAVLCGIPKLDLRVGVTARFLERLVSEVRRHYRYVILDVGAELLGREADPHRMALRCADQVLLVESADLVGLWHGRTGVALIQGLLGIDQDHVALIVNRHDRRFHHRQAEIEWALGLPTAAVIPNDQAGVQRALAEQHPLVLSGRGPAARALLDLAERVHGGTITLPTEKVRGGKLNWIRRAIPFHLARRPRIGGFGASGSLDDEHHTRDTARTAARRPRSGH